MPGQDAYNFDPEKVQELLLKSGPINEEEVTAPRKSSPRLELIQESMADEFLRRLAVEDPEEEAQRREPPGAPGPAAEGSPPQAPGMMGY
eukprot:Skav220951  [mRNA]  locus=scaffold2381:290122:291373:- [translate_table: standard]